MEYKRKKRGEVNSRPNKSQGVGFKTHVKNIAIMLGMVIGAIYIKVAWFGMTYNPDGNIVQKMMVSQPLSETKLAMRVDHSPSPELLKEIETLKKEIKDLKKPSSVVSRGEVDRSNEVLTNLTYDYNKMKEKTELLEILEDECRKHANGVNDKEFFEVIYSIVYYESHFNPNAVVVTAKEHSVGLLQVNTLTNKPKNIDVETFRQKLRNPRYNLDYQLDELYEFYKLGKAKNLSKQGLALFVAKYGQRPNWDNKDCVRYITKSIYQAYENLRNAKV